MLVSLTISILALVVCAVPVSAEQHTDPVQIPVASKAPKPLEVLWKERGGEILIDTVCFNYDDNPKKKGQCRKLAAEKFKEECERNKRLYYDSKPHYLKKYKDGMEKFCRAAKDFDL